MKDWTKRLEALEKTIKTAVESPVWIDGHNATVRVDVNRRGKETTFPSVYECRVWLEKQIDKHAGGAIGYGVDNVCDLFEDADELKAIIRTIIPDKLVIPDLEPYLADGQIVYREKAGPANHPQILSADYLPGTLAFCGISPGNAANIPLWCVAFLIYEHFNGVGAFKERFLNQRINDTDNALFTVLFVVYSWGKDDEPRALLSDFIDLFYHVTKFSKPDKAEISEAISEGETA